MGINAKERFFLIGKILGNSEFKLSAKFREELYKIFGMKLPTEVFLAMDYHLDWLYASLQITEDGSAKIYPNISLNNFQERTWQRIIKY